MREDERRRHAAVAEAARAFDAGELGRRAFLRACAGAGLALGAGALACRRGDHPPPSAAALSATGGPRSASEPGTVERAFLRDVGRTFRGTTLRVVSEDTPPSVATRELARAEFEPLTGIRVEWELLPLYRALAKTTADTGRRAGAHDLFYLDQAWLGRFVDDMADHRELLARAELAYPDYRFDDVLPGLVKHVATYGDRLMGIPYDIPIFILMYRRDVLERLGLPVPTTMPGYLDTVRAVHRELAPRVHGTTLQWRPADSPALECHMTAWLWAHGGSIFGPDGLPAIGDERAAEALAYMLELGRCASPAAVTFGWDEEAARFAAGEAGLYVSWGENFPHFDDPGRSRIVGLAEAAPCPRELALRPPEACGFGEVPGISHQGGSCLSVSRYSRHQEAAWVFLQWATSADITARASVLGGGASPIRRSTFDDPRVRAKAGVGVGTTRHFDVTLDAIEHRMGSEPRTRRWSELVLDYSIELGRLVTHQQDVGATLRNLASMTERATEAER